MSHPRPEQLLQVQLLAGLSEAAAEVLSQFFDVEQHEAGRRVVIEGTAGYAFYVVEAGRASVTHDGQELRTLGPGDFFGEIAILGSGRRTATVTAVEPMITWKMFGTAFRELEEAHPDVADELREVMQQRLATG